MCKRCENFFFLLSTEGKEKKKVDLFFFFLSLFFFSREEPNKVPILCPIFPSQEEERHWMNLFLKTFFSSHFFSPFYQGKENKERKKQTN